MEKINEKLFNLEKKAETLKEEISNCKSIEEEKELRITFDTLRKYGVMPYEDDALELESIYQRKKKKAEETEAKKKELDEINSLLDKLESFNLYTRKIICLK